MIVANIVCHNIGPILVVVSMDSAGGESRTDDAGMMVLVLDMVQ